MAAQLILNIFQGDRISRTFTLQNKDGDGVKTPMDLTGVSFAGYIKRTFDSDTHIPFVITIEDLASARISIFLDSVTTASMRAGEYVYDIELIEDAQNTYKILYGTIVVKNEVTAV